MIQQVAVDDGRKGRASLADYYNEHGERPGRWFGKGLAGLSTDEWKSTATPGSKVTEDQMRALFGIGMHPDAEPMMRRVLARRGSERKAIQAAKLGRAFITPNHDPDLTPFEQAIKTAFEEHRAALGLADDQPIPWEDRQAIWTTVGRRVFEEVNGRPARTPRELNGFIARQTRGPRQPIAGYDIVFSPPKSVSILWALGSREVSNRIAELHDQAVKESLELLESTLLYTREGTNGVFQVETRGLIAALFQHRDSRAGDPDLHTHAALSSKVQTLDGKWLTIDGTLIYQGMVAVSEHYTSRFKELLESDPMTMLRFTPVFSRPGTPPIWEIEGIDPRLIEAFSSRRCDIETRQEELTRDFQIVHGRLPTAEEGHALAQRATIETRPAKGSPQSLAQLREAWMEAAIEVLGSPEAVAEMLGVVLDPTEWTGLDRAPTVPDMALAVDTILHQITDRRAKFTDLNVIAEARRFTRRWAAHEFASVGAAWGVEASLEAIVDLLTETALASSVDQSRPEIAPAPEPIRRSDGTSPYIRAHSTLYTTDWILNAERVILDAAGQVDGRVARDVDVAVALLQNEASGRPLNPMQRELVAEMATSGRRVQLALAPAGSGKTTAMAALALAWRSSGGNVIGLCHQGNAVEALRQALGDGCPSGTIASITRANLEGRLSTVFWAHDDPAQPALARQIDHRTLIVIDEAAMAGTEDLAFLVGLAARRGASIRLVGDTKQLAAISAGGVLRDIEREYGGVTLDELVRFHDPAEGAATLAIRNGDHDGLGFYLDHGRVHAVNRETVVDTVFDAWRRDVVQGRDSLMMALHLDLVRELNLRAQGWRIADGQVSNRFVARLHDDTTAGAGDLIVTRQNDSTLRLSRTDHVWNRDRWLLRNVNPDGSLDVTSLRSGRLITLPSEYVEEHVELGYASTIAGSQGMTVWGGHTIFDGTENRNSGYVPLSRGMAENHIYVLMDSGDPEGNVHEASTYELTPTEILEQILDRDGEELSATGAFVQAQNPFEQLGHDAAAFAHALPLAARTILGPEKLQLIADAADRLMARKGYAVKLSECDAWEPLLDRLVILSAQGLEPIGVLAERIDQRGLDAEHADEQARDFAAVLHWRLEDDVHSAGSGPMAWLDPIPEPLACDATWGPFLKAHAAAVRAEADAVWTAALGWRAETAPRWAQPFVARHPELVALCAQWRAANAIRDNELAPAGERPTGFSRKIRQTWERLDRQLREAAGAAVLNERTGAVITAGRWDHLVPEAVVWDPLWPWIVARLTDADERGADVGPAIRQAMGLDRPLPDDHPAAALWYRVEPVVMPSEQAIPRAVSTRLRPAWTPILLGRLPSTLRAWVVNDPSWASLVGAVGSVPSDQTEALIQLAVDAATAQRTPADALAAVIAGHIRAFANPPLPDQTGWDEPPPDHTPEDEAWLAQTRQTQPDPQPEQHLASAPEPNVPPAHPTEPTEPDDPERHVRETEFAPPDDATDPTITPERLVELTLNAAAYYAAAYPKSPSTLYIRRRLGTDLISDDRFWVGHAPDEWTALTDHLRATVGATDEELVAAGLANWNRRGRINDAFRNRVMFAIRNQAGQIVGFSGRALPGSPDSAPKYYNTRSTAIFHKGETLFGGELLEQGATVVITEGPLDAIAVTLAGTPKTPLETPAVGVALCGTALTQEQIRAIDPYVRGRVTLVATDTDDAGWTAAERDLGLLAATGADARRPHITGKDPAAMWTTDPEALHRTLTWPDINPGLVSQIVARHADDLAATNQTRHLTEEQGVDPTTGLDLGQVARLSHHAQHLIALLPRWRRADEASAVADRIGLDPAALLEAAEAIGLPGPDLPEDRADIDHRNIVVDRAHAAATGDRTARPSQSFRSDPWETQPTAPEPWRVDPDL